MTVLRLYGTWEAADFFGVTKQTLHHWRSRDPAFPEPVEQLRSGPVWTHEQLEEYRKHKVGNVGRLSLIDARGFMELSVKQFEFYADQHQAKTSNESLSPEKIRQTLEKEQVNRELAAMGRKVLRGETPDDAPWITKVGGTDGAAIST